MTPEQIIEYLRTWAKLNAQEVYGSPAEFISVDRLNRVLSQIGDKL